MTASIEIEVVEVPMTGVKISYGSKSLKVKQSTYMSASYLPSDTTDTKSGTWKSKEYKCGNRFQFRKGNCSQ